MSSIFEKYPAQFILVAIIILLWCASPVGINTGWCFEIRTHGGSEKGKENNLMNTDQLTHEEGEALLTVARETIGQAISKGDRSTQPTPAVTSTKFDERRGTFVTLTIDGGLRGCIGHIIPQESLIEGIRVNAINAAFHDPRFRPLSEKEWKKVKIEISILTEPKTMPYADAEDLIRKLRHGIDGVIIKKGYHQATFLPQVWEQLPNKKEFLTHLCSKAGMDPDAWKKESIEVSTYQVQAFEED